MDPDGSWSFWMDPACLGLEKTLDPVSGNSLFYNIKNAEGHLAHSFALADGSYKHRTGF